MKNMFKLFGLLFGGISCFLLTSFASQKMGELFSVMATSHYSPPAFFLAMVGLAILVARWAIKWEMVRPKFAYPISLTIFALIYSYFQIDLWIYGMAAGVTVIFLIYKAARKTCRITGFSSNLKGYIKNAIWMAIVILLPVAVLVLAYRYIMPIGTYEFLTIVFSGTAGAGLSYALKNH